MEYLSIISIVFSQLFHALSYLYHWLWFLQEKDEKLYGGQHTGIMTKVRPQPINTI